MNCHLLKKSWLRHCDGVCCFGEVICDEHSEGEIENEHSVVEDIVDEYSVEDNNNAYDVEEGADDEKGICEDDGGKISHNTGAGGGEAIDDDEEGIFEDDSDDDSEVLFDVQLDISSG